MTGLLRNRVISALEMRTARWYDGLATDLVVWCWEHLAILGLDPASYGSMRMLKVDSSAPRHGHLSSNSGWDRPLLIELFDDEMATRYGPFGLRPPPVPFDLRAFESGLGRGMAELDKVGSVGAAIRTLVWSVTPVDVEGPEYDTGYSDPSIPLSIFIGAHPSVDQVSPIRMAEGLLHEAMHLQLSLIEDVVPLIRGSTDWHHSPWQHRLRPTQGLLHGIYVFRVIQDFFREAVAAGDLNSADLVHARNRICQIDKDCAELVSMRNSVDLTEYGGRFVEALLD